MLLRLLPPPLLQQLLLPQFELSCGRMVLNVVAGADVDDAAADLSHDEPMAGARWMD